MTNHSVSLWVWTRAGSYYGVILLLINVLIISPINQSIMKKPFFGKKVKFVEDMPFVSSKMYTDD